MIPTQASKTKPLPPILGTTLRSLLHTPCGCSCVPAFTLAYPWEPPGNCPVLCACTGLQATFPFQNLPPSIPIPQRIPEHLKNSPSLDVAWPLLLKPPTLHNFYSPEAPTVRGTVPHWPAGGATESGRYRALPRQSAKCLGKAVSHCPSQCWHVCLLGQGSPWHIRSRALLDDQDSGVGRLSLEGSHPLPPWEPNQVPASKIPKL